MEVVLIGSGNVATHLGLAFKAKGITIKQVYSKNPINAEMLAKKVDASFISDISEIYMDADIYIYALKDSVLKRILKQINIPAGIQVHTGGSIPMSEFEGFATRFGVFYPVQTFSVNKEVDFSNIPICIEACNLEVQKTLTELAKMISQTTYIVNSENRKKIHMACVFACNFTNYMYDAASMILEESGMTNDIIKPLIQETAEKIKTLSPFEAQTGPAVRMDDKTILKHITLLNKNSDLKKIYKLLTENIYKRHKKRI